MAATDIVTKDGKPHLDDPKVKEAVIKSLTYITTAFKGGYVPPGALSWNDADDNNAFHCQADRHGFRRHDLDRGRDIHDKEQVRRRRHVGLPHDNDGKPMPAQLGVGGAFIPKGAKNVEVAKDFIKYVIQPKVMNAYLKAGARPLAAGDARRWSRTIRSGSIPRTRTGATYVTRRPARADACSYYPVFNPGWAEVNAAQIWGSAEADVIRNGMTPEAMRRTRRSRGSKTILAKYPIVQS